MYHEFKFKGHTIVMHRMTTLGAMLGMVLSKKQEWNCVKVLVSKDNRVISMIFNRDYFWKNFSGDIKRMIRKLGNGN